jgi:hypothetical protein
MEAVGRAVVVGAAGMGALGRGLVVRVVDSGAVTAVAVAVAGVTGRAEVGADGMRSGRAARVIASLSN